MALSKPGATDVSEVELIDSPCLWAFGGGSVHIAGHGGDGEDGECPAGLAWWSLRSVVTRRWRKLWLIK
ncbi:hypothetical protein NL676_025609 [Syzygium grande]|nr:hypothetical protein NL676_025609 [Syzygium grande]